jgi:hypothetical protein
MMDQTLLTVLQFAFGGGLLVSVLRMAYSLGQYSSRIATIEAKLTEVDGKINELHGMIQDISNDFMAFKLEITRWQAKQLRG